MRYIRPVWLTHSGEKKDFEVYSCHVSPDGARLVTAAGGDISTRRGSRQLLNQSAQMGMSVFGRQTQYIMLVIQTLPSQNN